jgi:putative hydrolase of the HAD superfamily
VNWARIKAITFDAGGTLIEPYPSVGEVYAAVAAEFGFAGLSAAELNRGFASAWKQRRAFDYSPSRWKMLVEETFGGPLPGGLFEAIYERFRQPSSWRIWEDVRPALQTLGARGYRLAVISNWDERLRDLLKTLDLSRYLEFIVLSIEAGATKPSPLIFQCALDELKIPAGEVLHIGDSWSEDVEGARACGMAALLLDRRKTSASSISSLDQLPALLGVPHDQKPSGP